MLSTYLCAANQPYWYSDTPPIVIQLFAIPNILITRCQWTFSVLSFQWTYGALHCCRKTQTNIIVTQANKNFSNEKNIYLWYLIIYFTVYFPNSSILRVQVKPKIYVLADQPIVHNAGVCQGGSVFQGVTLSSWVIQRVSFDDAGSVLQKRIDRL